MYVYGHDITGCRSDLEGMEIQENSVRCSPCSHRAVGNALLVRSRQLLRFRTYPHRRAVIYGICENEGDKERCCAQSTMQVG